MALEGTVTTTERIPVTLNPADKNGQPAMLKRACRVTVTGGDGTPLQDDTDFNTIKFVSGAAEGDSTFTVDALDPNGGVTASFDMTLHVAVEPASSLNPSVGSPEPK